MNLLRESLETDLSPSLPERSGSYRLKDRYSTGENFLDVVYGSDRPFRHTVLVKFGSSGSGLDCSVSMSCYSPDKTGDSAFSGSITGIGVEIGDVGDFVEDVLRSCADNLGKAEDQVNFAIGQVPVVAWGGSPSLQDLPRRTTKFIGQGIARDLGGRWNPVW